MKNEDLETMLGGMNLPRPEQIKHQQELKIPLLSYKRSSRAGLWLLALPLMFLMTVILKYELVIVSSVLNFIEGLFTGVDENKFLTYLIPVIFVGLPLFSMVINLLSFSHFALVHGNKELLITIKYRPLNLAVFLLSFAILVFFLLPDTLP